MLAFTGCENEGVPAGVCGTGVRGRLSRCGVRRLRGWRGVFGCRRRCACAPRIGQRVSSSSPVKVSSPSSGWSVPSGSCSGGPTISRQRARSCSGTHIRAVSRVSRGSGIRIGTQLPVALVTTSSSSRGVGEGDARAHPSSCCDPEGASPPRRPGRRRAGRADRLQRGQHVRGNLFCSHLLEPSRAKCCWTCGRGLFGGPHRSVRGRRRPAQKQP